LDAVLGQHQIVLYIRMTCQTDDPARAKAYKNFIETVLPAVKTMTDKLDRKYIEARDKYAVDEKLYEVYDRNIKADIELFRRENVSLQTQDNLLSQEYQTIRGKMTVEFEGTEYTMPQMYKLQEETDRELREKAWHAVTGRFLQDADGLDELFDKMRQLRMKIAKNAGFDNYREYKFKQYHRFDYTANDCKEYHKAVEDLMVPVLGEIRKNKAQKMGLDVLRPWDLAVDALGREPLKPFKTVDEFINGAQRTFNNINPELGGQFKQMADLGLLDLESRKGKAPGGYQETLAEARKPFIFANSVGTYYDVLTLMHEAGHAFHVLACAEQPLFP
jgi:oligoendopeptidase F